MAKTSTIHVPKAPVATSQGIADRRDLALISVARTKMPMVVTDPRQVDNPIVLANQAFLDLTGYAPEEVVGRNCRFLQGPETSPETIVAIKAAINAGESLEIELLNYRKDGSTFFNLLHLSPVCDDAGQLIYFFSAQKDVTEHRHAQRLRDAEYRLLKELDHRSMNALAIVQAITRLTKADSVASYAGMVQSRVSAIARAHSLLSAGNWASVALHTLLEGEVEPYLDGRMKLEGPVVLLPPEQIQPLCLLVHEMTSNTATHGALSAPGGSVVVSWQTSETPARLDLSWRESGRAPQADRTAGFGFRIIDSVVRAQLRGRLERTWEADGLSVVMSMPLN